MLYYESEQERELSLYPKEYRFLTAAQNGDIISYGMASYNINRMDHFVSNYIHKMPDKIVLAYYKINGYPSIGILEYTGDLIIYTVRHYNQRDEAYYITYYGAVVFKHQIKIRDMMQRVYNLKTLDNKDVTVFRVLLSRE
jgi:hypothetical protein